MNKSKKSIIICMMFGISVFGIVGLANMTGVAAQPNTTLIYGTANGPVHWDPVFAWDSASFDVLTQITEGLYMYNYSAVNSTLVPMLASSSNWSANAKVLDVNIRSGITFQDGNPLNTSAVVWNFDRMNYVFGYTSGLPAPFTGTPSSIAQTQPLFTDPNGTQLIRSVTVHNATAVRFTLTMPYAAFTSLLAFPGAALLSPGSTPATRELNVTNSNYIPVGTGPFKFSQFSPSDYVYLKAYDNYWRGAPKLGGVYFDIINDAQTRNNAMLSQEIHILPDPLPNMVTAGDFNVSGEHVHKGVDDLVIQYIGMNNQLISQPMRKAIVYAFDYTYYITQILQNLAGKLHGIIPKGMAFYNGSIPYVAQQNLTAARYALINASYPGLNTVTATKQVKNDTWWINLAINAPLATYNYTYNAGNQVRFEVGNLLGNCSRLIGVQITSTSLSADDWGVETTNLANWSLQKDYPIFAMGWAPDYNDPDDYCRPLLIPSPITSDMAHVNDAFINKSIDESLNATTVQGRQNAYNAIMNYTQNQLYPWIFLHQGRLTQVWLDNITGYTMNIMDQCYFYNVQCAQCTLPAAATPGYDIALIGLAMIASSMVVYLVSRKKLRV